MGFMEFLHQGAEEVQFFLGETEPQTVTSETASDLVKGFSSLERICAAGKLIFAARAAESATWARDGQRSAANWLADKEKCSVGEAVSTLEISKRIGDLEHTKKVLGNGDINVSQAKQIAEAADKEPATELPLIEAAGTKSYKALKDLVRQILMRQSSEEQETERHRKIHAGRYLRHWSDYDGALRLDTKLTPDTGARILSAIDEEAKQIFEAKRKAGEKEPYQAYRADALVSLVCGGGSSRSKEGRVGPDRRDTIVIRVDAGALRRGHVEGEEICEVAGLGPIPVANLKRLLPDAFVKIVIRDSVDVLSVCHVGRTVTSHLRSALEERDRCCVVPGCDVSLGLEIHHWREDFATCKTTNLDSICRICTKHHDLITYEGFELRGGPGKWELLPPPRGRDPDSG